MKVKYFGILLVLMAIITINSCKKDEEKPLKEVSTEDAMNVSKVQVQSGEFFDAVFKNSEAGLSQIQAVGFENVKQKSAAVGGTFQFDIDKTGLLVFPKNIVITYLDWVNPDGKVINGKLKISLDNLIWEKNATRTITLENFSIDQVKIEGIQTTVYKGLVNSKPTIETTIQGGKVIFTNGKSITREEKKVFTMIVGADTWLNSWDDVFEITGNGSGTTYDGFSFTAVVSQPLIFSTGCSWIKSGVIELMVEKQVKAVINYGNGDCDDNYTILIGKTEIKAGSDLVN